MIEKSSTNFSIEKIVKEALNEDLGQRGDITSNSIIDKNLENSFVLKSRSDGIISGIKAAEMSFKLLNENIIFENHINDGSAVKPGDIIATIKGTARSILSSERTALNFLSHLSGIASATNEMVCLLYTSPSPRDRG